MANGAVFVRMRPAASRSMSLTMARASCMTSSATGYVPVCAEGALDIVMHFHAVSCRKNGDIVARPLFYAESMQERSASHGLRLFREWGSSPLQDRCLFLAFF